MKKNLYIIIFTLMSLHSCDDNIEINTIKAIEECQIELKGNTTTLELNKENASIHNALILKWDSLTYGISTASNYTIQIDKLSGDYSDAVEDIAVNNQYTYNYTDSLLNERVLKLGIKGGDTELIKIRIKANLANNAEIVYSNELELSVTPYILMTLKYPMPEELYLQGDAVLSEWGYPIAETQKMYKVDTHRFALNTYLYGGKRLAFISSNNYWTDPSYKALIEIENGIEGDFIPSGSATTPQWGGYDIIVPEDGYYNIIIDFITGQYKLTPIPSLLSTPEELYIIGDATILEWNVPNDAQKFEKIDETTFSIKVQLFSNKNYAFITSASTWSDPAYIMPIGNISEECINTGLIIASGEGNNWQGVQMQSPSITGTYNILVNFKSGVFVVSL